MNITNCPQCGGRVRSVSIGWKCESCQGFIDMRGEFHQHKEEPFMPPMTNADRIRAMSDEELAEYLAGISAGSILKLAEQFGVPLTREKKEKYIAELKEEYLKRLQSPAEEAT